MHSDSRVNPILDSIAGGISTFLHELGIEHTIKVMDLINAGPQIVRTPCIVIRSGRYWNLADIMIRDGLLEVRKYDDNGILTDTYKVELANPRLFIFLGNLLRPGVVSKYSQTRQANTGTP